MIPVSRFSVVILTGMVLLSGCTGSPGTTDPSSPTEPSTRTATPSQPDALDDRLYGLVVADNRTRYATRHELRLRNGSVQAIVRLEQGRSLPRDYDISVEVRADGRVQGWISVGNLVEVAKHRNVSRVHPPIRPERG